MLNLFFFPVKISQPKLASNYSPGCFWTSASLISTSQPDTDSKSFVTCFSKPLVYPNLVIKQVVTECPLPYNAKMSNDDVNKWGRQGQWEVSRGHKGSSLVERLRGMHPTVGSVPSKMVITCDQREKRKPWKHVRPSWEVNEWLMSLCRSTREKPLLGSSPLEETEEKRQEIGSQVAGRMTMLCQGVCT